MRRALRIIATLWALAAMVAVAFVATPAGALIFALARNSLFAPPAPPLLDHASAASGWFGGCPPRNAIEAAAQSSGEALSPELNQRLAMQFPAGSGATALVRTLTEQGFRLATACENDATIHRAYFQGPTRGAIFDTHAEIYWKTESDKVVWTKGFVMFVGL